MQKRSIDVSIQQKGNNLKGKAEIMTQCELKVEFFCPEMSEPSRNLGISTRIPTTHAVRRGTPLLTDFRCGAQ
jgi:hypothetical protein